ncbi:hypothetical protein Bca4012_026490 [Brassica carinata]|uniref:Uncharacterized protein n=1 Tax=Brassica carinata TaxID=52824 RepID=A0A8X7VIU4_BRACI|nr:hypothetical protein Bca52824_023525 [Brassica carinata]
MVLAIKLSKIDHVFCLVSSQRLQVDKSIVRRIQRGLPLLTAPFSSSIAQAMAEEAPLPSSVATSQPVE